MIFLPESLNIMMKCLILVQVLHTLITHLANIPPTPSPHHSISKYILPPIHYAVEVMRIYKNIHQPSLYLYE